MGKLTTRRTALAISLLAGLLLVFAGGCRGSPEIASDCAPEFMMVRQIAERTVRDLGLPGGALLLRRDGVTVCEAYFGMYDRRTAVPLVSAVKWLSAATILTLVDDGTLTLDDPASKYLPYFTGDKAGITLRQLLSHTSGIPPYHECMFMQELTLDQCVRRIAETDLVAPPGAEFNYSGAGFSVAGRMAEVASGKSWAELFETRIAAPLHLATINYGDTQNPLLSEGYALSSLNDYGTFLQMILDGGTYGGQQVLSAETIAEMRHDQRMGAAVADSPRGPVAYGLGVWLDRLDDPSGEAGQISSPGGGGFVPWVDYDRNLVGIFMIYDRIEPVWGMVLAMQQLAREAVDGQVGQSQQPISGRATGWSNELYFRIGLAAFAALFLAIWACYHLKKSISRVRPGVPSGRLLPIVQMVLTVVWCALVIAWLVEPHWLVWAVLDLPVWSRWGGAALGLLALALLFWMYRTSVAGSRRVTRRLLPYAVLLLGASAAGLLAADWLIALLAAPVIALALLRGVHRARS